LGVLIVVVFELLVVVMVTGAVLEGTGRIGAGVAAGEVVGAFVLSLSAEDATPPEPESGGDDPGPLC
jgi:hypothetical protein